MGVSSNIVRAIQKHYPEWVSPTPVQLATCSRAIKMKNIVVSAETGSGKTAAYLMPILTLLEKHYSQKKRTSTSQSSLLFREERGLYSPLALIMCPTHELVHQVAQHAELLSSNLSDSVNILSLAYSDSRSGPNTFGSKYDRNKPIDLLISTPGRILQYLKKRSQYLSQENAKEMEENSANHLDDDAESSHPSSSSSSPSSQKSSKSEGINIVGVDLSNIKWLVLDECDRMLSMGFFPDIKDILEYMPRPRKNISDHVDKHLRQSESITGDANEDFKIIDGMRKKVFVHTHEKMQLLLFSATIIGTELDKLVLRLAPRHVRVNLNASFLPNKNIDHIIYSVSNRRKFSLLKYLMKRKGTLRDKQMLIFVRTQQRAERICELLNNRNFGAKYIHKLSSPTHRRTTLDDFKAGKFQCLVATDVASRGIDIMGLPFVINFDVPISPQDYIHRVGRTGRGGDKGRAISFVGASPSILNFNGKFVEHSEMYLYNKIVRFLGDSVKLYFRKIPGPWKEDDKEVVAKEELETQRYEEKKSHELNKLLDTKPELSTSTLERLQSKVEKRKKLPRTKRHGVLELEDITLRHLKQARYEDVVYSWDIKRAVKRGVGVSSSLTPFPSTSPIPKRRRPSRISRLQAASRREKMVATAGSGGRSSSTIKKKQQQRSSSKDRVKRSPSSRTPKK